MRIWTVVTLASLLFARYWPRPLRRRPARSLRQLPSSAGVRPISKAVDPSAVTEIHRHLFRQNHGFERDGRAMKGLGSP